MAISVPLVLAGTLIGLKLAGIDLQRISLGSMIIALGLLVDDAIIAVETMVVKLDQGWDRMRAGSFAYTSTAFPMLTGTLVTAAGYLPVGLAQSSTGEYTRDIFRVVGIALVLSWFVAVLFVPYLGSVLLPQGRQGGRREGSDEASEAAHYDTPFYRAIRRAVFWCMQARWWVIGGTVAGVRVLPWPGSCGCRSSSFHPLSGWRCWSICACRRAAPSPPPPRRWSRWKRC